MPEFTNIEDLDLDNKALSDNLVKPKEERKVDHLFQNEAAIELSSRKDGDLSQKNSSDNEIDKAVNNELEAASLAYIPNLSIAGLTTDMSNTIQEEQKLNSNIAALHGELADRGVSSNQYQSMANAIYLSQMVDGQLEAKLALEQNKISKLYA